MKTFKILLLFIIGICLTGCKDAIYDEEDTYGNVQVGDKIPEFSVNLTDGTTVSNNTLLNNNALIVFFNTNCGDCQYDLPYINTFYNTVKDNGDLNVVCIAREQYANETVQYWTEKQFSLPFSTQEDRTIFNKFAKNTIPRLYFCNKNGKVIAMFDDSDSWTYLDKETNEVKTATVTSSKGRMASLSDMSKAYQMTIDSNN